MTRRVTRVVSRRSLYYNLPVSHNSAVPPEHKRGFFRILWRALQQLFHETTAAIFGIFALASATSAIRSWRSGAPRWYVALPVGYAAMMIFFCVTSFRTARRIR